MSKRNLEKKSDGKSDGKKQMLSNSGAAASPNGKTQLARLMFGEPAVNARNKLELKYWLQKADEAYRRKDYNGAYVWYKKMADAGNIDAAFNVFNLLNNFEQHITVEKDKKAAVDHYLSIAVHAEMPEAIHEQANLFYEGRFGHKKDLAAALQLFQLASNLDYLPSIYFTGTALVESSKPDIALKGFTILQKLVYEKNYLDAILALANCYYLGRGTEVDHKKAFELFEVAYKKGILQAGWRLANCYLKAEGVARDIPKAFKILEEGAAKGSCESLMLLAEIYEKGLFGKTSDLKKFYECISKADSLGNSFAKCKTGIALLFGTGVVANRKLGYSKIEAVAREGNGFALYMLGICHYTGMGTPKSKKNFKLAFECYQKSAELRSEQGIRALAIAYKNGEGVDADPKKAFELIEKLANSGSLEDKTVLASYYMEGIGVPVDYTKAIQLAQEVLDHADAKHFPDAYLTMSILSSNGWGMQKDVKRSLELLEIASQQNYIPACVILADRYRDGMFVEKDHKRSFEYIQRALEIYQKRPANETFNSRNIHTIAGDYYLLGIGTERDHAKAVAHFGKSVAQNNHPEACIALGLCNLLGWGTEANPDKAFFLFEQAFKAGNTGNTGNTGNSVTNGHTGSTSSTGIMGNTQAQVNVAWCYLYGIGTQKDPKRAYEYFVEAAKKGSKIAQSNRAWCLLNGLGVEQDIEQAVRLFGTLSTQLSSIPSFGASYKGNTAILFPPEEDPIKVAERQYYFALCEMHGWGVEFNPKGAFEKLQELSNVLVGAKITIADCYLRGIAVTKDESRGHQLLLPLAEISQAAKVRLARTFMHGSGTDKDVKRAIELLEEAAKTDYPEAIEKLAFAYENGLGVAVDNVKAIELYEKAARLGSLNAQVYLGQRYQYGHSGLDYDIKKSVEFLQMAAKRGDLLAGHELAECYEDGKGIPKSIGIAAEIYRGLANLEYAPAQVNLGLLLEDGWDGCAPSKAGAVKLYELASERSEPLGKLNLARCYEEGIGVLQDLAKAAEFQAEGERLRRDFLPMKTRAFRTADRMADTVAASATVTAAASVVALDSRLRGNEAL